jgi:hypothetical protein
VTGGVGDGDVRTGGDTGAPVPTGGVLPLPTGGVLPLPTGGVLPPSAEPSLPLGAGVVVVVVVPLEGAGAPVAGGGAVVLSGGETWVLPVLLLLLLPLGSPVVGAVCGSGAGSDGLESTGGDVVALEFVSGGEGEVEFAEEGGAAAGGDVAAVDTGVVATDNGPDVPAGASARASATAASAKTIVARTRLSVVR